MMMTTTLLRGGAIAIAVAALADPAVLLSGRARPRLSIASLAGAASEPVADRLAQSLRTDFDVVRGLDATAAATIVVGDRYPAITLPADMPVSTVTVATPAAKGVRITGVRAPKRVPPQTALRVEADIDATGMSGASSVVTITSGGVEVGRLSHTWRDANERWRAALEVVPVGEAPFALRVAVDDADAADVLVAAARAPLRVLVYEPRPSWTSTFVRRSLEGDPRFAVSSLSYASRGVAVRAGEPVSLGSADDLANIDVIAVGGLERLTAAEAASLERFLRERGGSVALLPDGRVDDVPVRALVPSPLPSEALLDVRAALSIAPPLPRLDASELLVFRSAPAGAEVLARLSGSNDPVILVVPNGDGRLLFSGALDAWRSRADSGVEFDRFWRSAFAGLALAAPPVLDVDVSPPILAAGDTARVMVRVRAGGSAVSASLDGGDPIRLWPDATPGMFSGSFVAPSGARPHAVDVVASGALSGRTRGVFLVSNDAKPFAPAAPLALLAASHGGIDVPPGALPALEHHIRQRITGSSAPASRHPMRSPWWLMPFAVCLTGEWWLRRRLGLG